MSRGVGALHAKRIDHPKYLNVSVEQINYTPISLDEIRQMSDGADRPMRQLGHNP